MTGERILIVDDSKENRDFLVSAVLKPGGFESIQARDGLEGLKLARDYNPDLILLDLQMPRMNGIQVLEALQSENLSIPVILMTFHGSEDVAVEVFRLGVRDYVKKPYTADEMLAAIDSSLTETRLRREKEALTNRLLAANRDLHARVQELNTLYSIGKSVTALLDPPQLMGRVVEAAVQLTNAEQGNLWLVEYDPADPTRATGLKLRAVRIHGEARARPVNEASNNRLARRAIEIGKPVAFSAAELAQMSSQAAAALPASALILPLRVGDRTIGALGVERVTDESAPFSPHDGALLAILADYAAISLENAHNYAALAAFKDEAVRRG
jgi:two-component system NtrC family sensor kinase